MTGLRDAGSVLIDKLMTRSAELVLLRGMALDRLRLVLSLIPDDIPLPEVQLDSQRPRAIKVSWGTGPNTIITVSYVFANPLTCSTPQLTGGDVSYVEETYNLAIEQVFEKVVYPAVRRGVTKTSLQDLVARHS